MEIDNDYVNILESLAGKPVDLTEKMVNYLDSLEVLELLMELEDHYKLPEYSVQKLVKNESTITGAGLWEELTMEIKSSAT